MAKNRIEHVCTDCGATHPKWAGQCSGCGVWNSLVEEFTSGAVPVIAPAASIARPIGDVDPLTSRPRPTGIGELDRVLGGGIVPGSVTLLGGEPGIGKSTLLLQLLANLPGTALYVTAEESAQQVRLRAERLDAVRPDLWLLAETALPHVIAAVDEVRPDIVVIDSIQTVHDPALGSPPGSVVQVRGCTQQLIAVAKQRDLPVVLVGHVTKEGSLAGPRVLEHVVDTVLVVRGRTSSRAPPAARHQAPVRAHQRARPVRDGRSTASSACPIRASCSSATVAPVCPVRRSRPRWRASGHSWSRCRRSPRRHRPTCRPAAPPRVSTATGWRCCSPCCSSVSVWRCSSQDVYASTVGGVRLVEPGLDLAMCLAVVSAITDRPLPSDLVVFGEVGLGGELRQVAHAPRRLSEAARLGFTRVIAPTNVAGARRRRDRTWSGSPPCPRRSPPPGCCHEGRSLHAPWLNRCDNG